MFRRLLKIKDRFNFDTFNLVAIIFVLGTIVTIVFEGILQLSKGWLFFTFYSFGYFFVSTYLCIDEIKKIQNENKGFFFLLFIEISLIAIVFSILFFELVRIPETGLIWTWTPGFIVFTGLTVSAFKFIVNKNFQMKDGHGGNGVGPS